jgi:hypothetical protein
MCDDESERAQPKGGDHGEKETKRDMTTPGAPQADDVTMGEEAQKHRDKMMHQEKAEGDRR